MNPNNNIHGFFSLRIHQPSLTILLVGPSINCLCQSRNCGMHPEPDDALQFWPISTLGATIAQHLGTQTPFWCSKRLLARHLCNSLSPSLVSMKTPHPEKSPTFVILATSPCVCASVSANDWPSLNINETNLKHHNNIIFLQCGIRVSSSVTLNGKPRTNLLRRHTSTPF